MARVFRLIVVYPALLCLFLATFGILLVWRIVTAPFRLVFARSESEPEKHVETWGPSPVEGLQRIEAAAGRAVFTPTEPFVPSRYRR